MAQVQVHLPALLLQLYVAVKELQEEQLHILAQAVREEQNLRYVQAQVAVRLVQRFLHRVQPDVVLQPIVEAVLQRHVVQRLLHPLQEDHLLHLTHPLLAVEALLQECLLLVGLQDLAVVQVVLPDQLVHLAEAGSS